MAPNDTPPASPSVVRDDDDNGEGDEDVELEEGDVVEVIDLDEVMRDGDEDDEAEGDSSNEAGAAAAATGSRSSSRLETPPEDNSDVTFTKHENSVFCCALSPRSSDRPPLAATGGEDDRAFLWDPATGETVLECSGFKDSVVQVGFSHDGAFLAAADMSGVTRVWKVDSREVVWEFETSDVTWMSWHAGANVLFSTTADSELWMWKIPSGESKIFAGHGERAETATILPDGRRAMVGYGDGAIRVFELRTGGVAHVVSGAHSSAVASADARRDNNLVATGGVDGVAKIHSLQAGAKCVATFACGAKTDGGAGGGGSEDEEVGSQSTVESVLFSEWSSEQNLLVTGTLEGVVNVWDVSTQASRLAFSVGSGVVKMRWSRRRDGATATGSGLLVATLDGTVRLVDVRTGKTVADCSGHTQAILDFDQSRDGNLILTTSDDGTSKAFDLAKIVAAGSSSTPSS